MKHEYAIRLLEAKAVDLEALASKIDADLSIFTLPSIVDMAKDKAEAHRAAAAEYRAAIAVLEADQ